MDRTKETESEPPFSDKSKIEQANILMDRQFNEDTDIEQPEEMTIPFINRNQS